MVKKAVFCMPTAKPKITARRTEEQCTGCHLEQCFGGAWQSKEIKKFKVYEA